MKLTKRLRKLIKVGTTINCYYSRNEFELINRINHICCYHDDSDDYAFINNEYCCYDDIRGIVFKFNAKAKYDFRFRRKYPWLSYSSYTAHVELMTYLEDKLYATGGNPILTERYPEFKPQANSENEQQ